MPEQEPTPEEIRQALEDLRAREAKEAATLTEQQAHIGKIQAQINRALAEVVDLKKPAAGVAGAKQDQRGENPAEVKGALEKLLSVTKAVDSFYRAHENDLKDKTPVRQHNTTWGQYLPPILAETFANAGRDLASGQGDFRGAVYTLGKLELILKELHAVSAEFKEPESPPAMTQEIKDKIDEVLARARGVLVAYRGQEEILANNPPNRGGYQTWEDFLTAVKSSVTYFERMKSGNEPALVMADLEKSLHELQSAGEYISQRAEEGRKAQPSAVTTGDTEPTAPTIDKATTSVAATVPSATPAAAVTTEPQPRIGVETRRPDPDQELIKLLNTEVNKLNALYNRAISQDATYAIGRWRTQIDSVIGRFYKFSGRVQGEQIKIDLNRLQTEIQAWLIAPSPEVARASASVGTTTAEQSPVLGNVGARPPDASPDVSAELTPAQKAKVKNALEQEAARKRIRYVAETAALRNNPDLLNADKIREKFAGDSMLFRVIARDILGQDYSNFSASLDKEAREKSVAGLREALQKAGYTEDILKSEQYEQVYDALIADRDNQATKEKAEQEKKRGFWSKVGRGVGKAALYAGAGLAGGTLAGPMGGIMAAGSVRFVDGLFKIRAERKAVATFSQKALGDPDGKVCKGFAEKLAVMVSSLAENNLRTAEGAKPTNAAELAKHFFGKVRTNIELPAMGGDYANWSDQEKDSLAQKLALYYVSEEKTDGILSEERKQKLGGLWSRIHGRDGFARGHEIPWSSTLKGYITGGDREMDRSFADKRADGVFGLVTGTLLATALRSAGLGRVFAAYGGARLGMRLAQGREGIQSTLEPRKAARVAIEAAKAGFTRVQTDLANPADRHHVLHKLEAEVGANIILARQAMTRLEAEGSGGSMEYATLRNELNKMQLQYALAQTEAVFIAKTNTERAEKMEQILHAEESLETLINKKGEQKTAAARWKVRRGAVYGAILGLALAEGAHQAFEYYQNTASAHLVGVQQNPAPDSGSAPSGAGGTESLPGGETLTSPVPTVDFNQPKYLVGHHEGITHPIMRQLEARGMSPHDAMLKARDIALQEGWIKPDGSETWVRPENEIAVELHTDNSVTVHDLKPATVDDLYQVGRTQAAHAEAVASGQQATFEHLVDKLPEIDTDHVYALSADDGMFTHTIAGEDHRFEIHNGIVDVMDGQALGAKAVDLSQIDAGEKFAALTQPARAFSNAELLSGAGGGADNSIKDAVSTDYGGTMLSPPSDPDHIVPAHVTAGNVLRHFGNEYYIGTTNIVVPGDGLAEIKNSSVTDFVNEHQGVDWGPFSGWERKLANHIAKFGSGFLASHGDEKVYDLIEKTPRGFGGE